MITVHKCRSKSVNGVFDFITKVKVNNRPVSFFTCWEKDYIFDAISAECTVYTRQCVFFSIFTELIGNV